MGLQHGVKGFEDDSTITMIQEKDLGRGIPKSATVDVPEPVVEETKPLTKLEQYKLRLEEKEKQKQLKQKQNGKLKKKKKLLNAKQKKKLEK